MGDGHSRIGESGSPKRVLDVCSYMFVEDLSRRGVGVVLGECVARPGERISPKRDDGLMILF